MVELYEEEIKPAKEIKEEPVGITAVPEESVPVVKEESTDLSVVVPPVESEPEATENVPAETQEEKKVDQYINPEEYRTILNMLKEMEEWNKTLTDMTIEHLKNDYALKPQCLLKISSMSYDDIEKLSYEEIKEFFNTYKLDPGRDYNHLCADNLNDAISDMKDIKKSQLDLMESTNEINNLKSESNEVLDDFMKYMYSPKIVEIRERRLRDLKDKAKYEKDEVKRSKMIRMITTMEKNNTMAFIFDRIDSYGEKEIINIMQGFFREPKGSYIIDRYNSKISKYGFKPDTYKLFLNLEENFLPEEYHPFNNIFLFHYMRFIAYSDPYNKEDKLFIQHLTSSLSGLIYHKYENSEMEKSFIDIIKRFDDHFKPYKDFFYENNTTRPNHPVRIENSAKYEADKKAQIIHMLEEIGVTDYDKEASSKELMDYFNTKYNEISSDKAKEKKEEVVTEEKPVTEGVTESVVSTETVTE